MTDFVGASNKLQFVLDQLAQYSGTKITQSGYTFVLCPFHAESTPSGRVFHGATTKSPGYFKCYGCSARGTWDDVAPKLGLKPFKHQKPADEFLNMSLLSAEIPVDDDGFVQEEMKLDELPEGKVWRGIKTSLLTKLGAKKCRVKHPEHGWLKTKVYLPVFINKELRGYIKARLTKSADYPSYINAKGSWSKTHGLFPFDFAISMAKRLRVRTIVLVEGPRDALRLLQLGIPAVCILGTQSWSDTKSKLLELAGITRIILMMDGDCAGIAATTMLDKALRAMFKVTIFRLWAIADSPYHDFEDEDEPSKAAKAAGVSLWDPGSVPLKVLEAVKDKYFSPRK